MKVFVHEYITGGGLLEGGADNAAIESLQQEGLAMVTALAGDFARLPGVDVQILSDRRLAVQVPGCQSRSVSSAEDLWESFDAAAAEAAWTVVIAPEMNSTLLRLCRRVLSVGDRLLGPDPEWVRWSSDKQETAERLGHKGIAVPTGVAVAQGVSLPDDFSYPAVFKPRDGAGSTGVRLIESLEDARNLGPARFDGRLERYVPGTPTSVTVLSGPTGTRTLRPCLQILSEDGTFQFHGSALIEDASLADRATRLAESVVRAVPPFGGMIGIDMILAKHPNDDVVIEINPRITTSYVTLRDAYDENLAGVLLALMD